MTGAARFRTTTADGGAPALVAHQPLRVSAGDPRVVGLLKERELRTVPSEMRITNLGGREGEIHP